MGKKFIVRSDIPKEPALVIENQPLITPGTYYNVEITSNDIQEFINLTDWDNPYNTALIYGHKTNTNNKWIGNPSPEDWVGSYSKPVWKTTGVPKPGAYSDIKVYDSNFAAKLAYGKVRCGVSAAIDLQGRTFRNLSIIDNPKCKDAYLNLSDDEAQVSIGEPLFLNLSNEGKDDEPKDTDINIDERRLNDEKMNKEMTDKMKVFDEKFSKFESALEDITKAISEKKVEEKPKEVDEKPKEVVEEISKEPESKPLEVEDKPVVIETPETPEDVKSDAVVDAINKMGDKMVTEVGKIANPQSVAPTNPNAVQSDMDDEKITEKLVEQYSKLHPKINSNE